MKKYCTALFVGVLLSCIAVRSDGPDLRQHMTITNGVIYVTADIPACHYARWERRVLPSTNWFAADSADYEFFTRKVIFSEAMPAFNMSWYRIEAIYVPWCATLNLKVFND